MSKRHGAKKRRKAKASKHVLCASCRKPADKPWGLLASLAASLNACEDAGLAVRLRHGIVMAPKGYVLPLKDGRWAARTLDYESFPVPAGDDDPDLED